MAQVQSLTDQQTRLQATIQALQIKDETDSEADPNTFAHAPPAPQPASHGAVELLQQPVFRDAASPEPEPYAGDLGICSGFLLQVELAFGRSPRTFINDTSRISFLVGKLRGRALRWAEAYLASNPLLNCCYDDFLDAFKKTFAHPISEGSTALRLLSLCQGRRSIADYLIDFRTAAVEAGWADQALQGIFLQSLNDNMKDQLASRDEPTFFEALASLALRIDNRLREREREKGYKTQRKSPRMFPNTIFLSFPACCGSIACHLSCLPGRRSRARAYADWSVTAYPRGEGVSAAFAGLFLLWVT